MGKVILFAFDLTQRSSMFSVKRWYKEARKENKMFMPFLIGTKFDLFEELEEHNKTEITKNARKFARKMHAPLIYCSSAQSINVKKIFQVIIGKVFNLKPKIKEAHVEFEGNVADENGDEEEDEANGGKGKKDKKKRKDKKEKKRKKDKKKRKRKKKKEKSKKKKESEEEDEEEDDAEEDGDDDDSKEE